VSASNSWACPCLEKWDKSKLISCSAWKIPELIKASGENITIATFSEFGFYKLEGYESNLWAGKILADHGVPVAYKSVSCHISREADPLLMILQDHTEEELSAKYLM
jgi:hypothetical protein